MTSVVKEESTDVVMDTVVGTMPQDGMGKVNPDQLNRRAVERRLHGRKRECRVAHDLPEQCRLAVTADDEHDAIKCWRQQSEPRLKRQPADNNRDKVNDVE